MLRIFRCIYWVSQKKILNLGRSLNFEKLFLFQKESIVIRLCKTGFKLENRPKTVPKLWSKTAKTRERVQTFGPPSVQRRFYVASMQCEPSLTNQIITKAILYKQYSLDYIENERMIEGSKENQIHTSRDPLRSYFWVQSYFDHVLWSVVQDLHCKWIPASHLQNLIIYAFYPAAPDNSFSIRTNQNFGPNCKHLINTKNHSITTFAAWGRHNRLITMFVDLRSSD